MLGTDERSKVSPVEEAVFCRSHASTSLHTHIVHQIPGGRRDSAGSHYRNATSRCAGEETAPVRTLLWRKSGSVCVCKVLIPSGSPIRYHQHLLVLVPSGGEHTHTRWLEEIFNYYV
ncbi:hypothetical protein PAMP_023423 [Pampus punctatissimus]